MKITLAFLLLGTCLVFSDARSVPKKPVHEIESFSHARMLSGPLTRWRELQGCDHRCTPVERSCKLRAIIADCFLLLNVISNDLGVGVKKLLSMKTDLKITILIDYLGTNDYESYANHVEKT
ncbi:unnamed protein product, partial [Staurois parvus]